MHITLITTGGTIASVKGENGLHPGKSGADLLAALGARASRAGARSSGSDDARASDADTRSSGSDDVRASDATARSSGSDDVRASHAPASGAITVDVKAPFALDSANITPAHWVTLARLVAGAVAGSDAILLTHGTDTLSYTAAALSAMLEGLPIPLVLTGSQIPLGAPGSDAPANLRLALAAAEARRPGVMVAFGGLVIAGSDARKIHTTAAAAFTAASGAPLARLEHGELRWSAAPDETRRANGTDMPHEPAQGVASAETSETAAQGVAAGSATQGEMAMQGVAAGSATARPFRLRDRLDERVAILKLYPGMDAALLTALIADGYRSIIIEGFGAGGVPSQRRDLLAAIADATARGIRIIAASQCTHGGADLTLYENGILAARAGMLSGGAATTETLYIREMLYRGEQGDSHDAK